MKKKLMKFASIIAAISLVTGGWSMTGGNVIIKAATVNSNKAKDTAYIEDNTDTENNLLSAPEQQETSDSASGTCGDNLTWELSNDGTLVISGTGDMYDYSSGYGNYSPFQGNLDVQKVIIKEGVTSIGDGSFLDCNNLISVEIADTVTRIGKVKGFDLETGELFFDDGQSYFISNDLEESPSDFIGQWCVYTISTSQSEGTRITDIEPVKTELDVTLTISKKEIYYKDGEFGFDNENLEGRSGFEIPYTLRVESKTNANENVISQLKNEAEYDITVEDLNIEIPSSFNFGWVFNEGDIQSINKGTVLHAGDIIGAEGFIRPGLSYIPEEVTNTYSIKCTLKASSQEYSSGASFTVTENYSDASMDKLETAASQALDDISDNIAITGMTDFFDQDTRDSLSKTLLSIALMAKADKQDLEDALSEDLFDQIFGDWKLKTGAATYDVPVEIIVNTEGDGELKFKFTMHMTSFNLNGSDFGIFGSIDYEIVDGKKLQDVPPNLRSMPNVGVISQCDVKAFCGAAYELAEKEIKKSYNMVWGDDANKAADIIFGQTIKDILKANNTSFSDVVFKVITSPATSYEIKCPVDVYLYDESGELSASIVDNKIVKTSELIQLEVVGDTKVVTLWDGTYNMKLVSNGSGNMDVTVTEYSGINNEMRIVDFYDMPLGEELEYSMDVRTELLANEYALLDNNSMTINPDQDRIILEIVKPGDSEEPGQPEEPVQLPYSDVHEGDWFYDSVKYVYQEGIMTGLNETTFGPAEDLSRAQFAVILYRMEGSPETEYRDQFKDVSSDPGQFYRDAVMWASSEDVGIITGYTEGPLAGCFGPADQITREQMAVMMYRYAQYKGYDVTGGELGSFPDGDKVSAFAQEAMGWANSIGLITGNDDGTLAPQGTASRAVCATIIERFRSKF